MLRQGISVRHRHLSTFSPPPFRHAKCQASHRQIHPCRCSLLTVNHFLVWPSLCPRTLLNLCKTPVCPSYANILLIACTNRLHPFRNAVVERKKWSKHTRMHQFQSITWIIIDKPPNWIEWKMIKLKIQIEKKDSHQLIGQGFQSIPRRRWSIYFLNI